MTEEVSDILKLVSELGGVWNYNNEHFISIDIIIVWSIYLLCHKRFTNRVSDY